MDIQLAQSYVMMGMIKMVMDVHPFKPLSINGHALKMLHYVQFVFPCVAMAWLTMWMRSVMTLTDDQVMVVHETVLLRMGGNVLVVMRLTLINVMRCL